VFKTSSECTHPQQHEQRNIRIDAHSEERVDDQEGLGGAQLETTLLCAALDRRELPTDRAPPLL
jgi:hypothetical protein